MIVFGKTVFTYSVVTQRDCIDFSMMNTETGGVRHYEVSKVYNQLDKIVSSLMCDGVYWCSYNGRYHDETILNYCIVNYKELMSRNVSDMIFLINSFADTVHTNPVQDWTNYKHAHKFNSFDLAPLFYSKGVASFADAMFDTSGDVVNDNMKVPSGCFSDRRMYSRKLSQDNVSHYTSLLESRTGDVLFREFIEREYSINVMNDSITSVGMKLLRLFYSEKATYTPVENRYTSIKICDLIPEGYSFGTARNNAFLSELKDTEISAESDISVAIPDKASSFTAGGLKGFKDKGVFHNKDRHIYYVDFKSAWPSMVVNFKIAPAGMFDDAFTYAVGKMVGLRRSYNQQFKLAVNAMIGNLMVEGSEIHDFKAFMKIKVMSALETVSLIESLRDIDVLQINNDGVVFTCKKPKDAILMELGEWEDKHNIRLNFKEYKMFCQRSINDWFAVGSDGNVISSGFFKCGSAKYPLASSLAVRIALTDNRDVDSTMALVDNSKYVIHRKVGKDKSFVVKRDGTFEPIGPNVSYTVCRNGDNLYLRDSDMSIPRPVCMNVRLGCAAYKDIDTMWYLRKAYQLYYELTTQQLKLF